MKKRLLLFAAVLTASANFVLAENKTVQDSNGNTFSYDTTTDLDASSYEGETIYADQPSFDIITDQYKVTLKSDLRIQVNNSNLIYNVRLASVSETPGTIATFTERIKSSTTVYDVVVNEEDIVYTKMSGNYVSAYTPNKTSKEFEKYIVACTEIKRIQPSIIFTGTELKSAKWNNTVIDEDDDGVEIVDELYYMNFRRNKFLPILNIDGDYARGTIYNNCYATYNPVGIVDGYQTYTITGDGKVGFVHGVVDDGKVEEILSNINYTYLNYDFTDVSIIGSVATDIIDNRLAYFNKNTDVTGQNVVVGTTCESYVIADNGQEIYVDKSFAAEESKYRRTFTPDSYGTIVLPFSVNNTGSMFVKQAVLTDYDSNENKLTFTSSAMIAPNTPYLFKALSTVSGESTFYGQVNGTVEATTEANSPKYDGAQFIGTFEGLAAEEVSNYYVVGSTGKIGRTKNSLKPGRCYFTREVNTNASAFNPTVVFIDEDGSATAIDSVATEETVSVQYLSVNGQISSQPFSGVNIVKKTFKDGSVKTSKVVF